MKLETADLTKPQAKILRKLTKRAMDMYDDRSGTRRITDRLRHYKIGFDKVATGEENKIRLGHGLKGDTRERVIEILEIELDMAREKNGHEPAWGIGGKKINTAERGLEKLRDPDETPRDTITAD